MHGKNNETAVRKGLNRITKTLRTALRKLPMKIRVAQSAGFCFGVKRALDIALKTAATSAKVYMLGDIVHNEDVIKQIEQAGVQKIGRLTHGKEKILLIRAHGASVDTLRKAERLGYAIVNATCPMVREIHTIARRMEQNGCKIIVIGDKKHDEVLGIIGQLKTKALVIENAKDAPLKTVKKIKNACVVVQSTQNMEKALQIVKYLRKHIPRLEFFNTICRPTRIKQAEIKKLPLVNDVVIIIGSKNSANTKRLYEISHSLNKKSYWISAKDQIKQAWFKGVNSVGITAGASTPQHKIQEVVTYIKRITSYPRRPKPFY